MPKVNRTIRPLLLVVLALALNGCGGGGGGALPLDPAPSADDARRAAVASVLMVYGPVGSLPPREDGCNVYTVTLECGAVIEAWWYDGTDAVTMAATDTNYRDVDEVTVPISGMGAALDVFPNWYQYQGSIK